MASSSLHADSWHTKVQVIKAPSNLYEVLANSQGVTFKKVAYLRLEHILFPSLDDRPSWLTTETGYAVESGHEKMPVDRKGDLHFHPLGYMRSVRFDTKWCGHEDPTLGFAWNTNADEWQDEWRAWKTRIDKLEATRERARERARLRRARATSPEAGVDGY